MSTDNRFDKTKFHINSLQTVLLLAVIDIEARCTM